MELRNDEISDVVRRVLQELSKKEIKPDESDGIFNTVDEAVDAASKAQRELMEMPLEQREKLIAAMRKAVLENAMEISRLTVSETGMGRVNHKYLKLRLVAEKTPGTEVLKTTAYTGDKGLTLVEMAPYGVIAAITPSTNPPDTIACNSIGMVAAGNSVVFSPHPGAVNCSLQMIRLLNKAIVEAGGPRNMLTSVRKPSIENTDALINHPEIKLVVATGGPGIVKKVLSSGKKAIGAGAGNPPVVVDETADIKKAARDIIAGCSFDNNLPCIAEKEAIVVGDVYDEIIEEMKNNGNVYELNEHEIEKLMRLILTEEQQEATSGCDIVPRPRKYGVNKRWVGKDAAVLLENIGVNPPKGVECLICRTDNDHPFVQEELMMPVLPIVRAKDIDHAIELAVKDEHGNRHTAMMHSKNVDNLTKMARVINTTIFVKNAPSYAGIGFGGEGFTTFTIAGPTGEGLTNAATFTRQRRCVMVDSFRII
ncbi:aldehyde dehydrogenase family protein [Calorimonas adulescens]|jgi:Aldehyde dehydrogenase family.|uniref:Aldehyde dehydrogenase EutE n=1 Tax=Calorimonas adulescens TaxID=2606906 RepID=A0A5D8QF04_9THEO|nr:aldehyde dehydrogenase family protein [Calorimonas adulescens]TZE83007.1 aldehyde dehydrogenase EutE [Calorimonas adulescens]